MCVGASDFANAWLAQNIRQGQSLRRESPETKQLVIELADEASRSGFTLVALEMEVGDLHNHIVAGRKLANCIDAARADNDPSRPGIRT